MYIYSHAIPHVLLLLKKRQRPQCNHQSTNVALITPSPVIQVNQLLFIFVSLSCLYADMFPSSCNCNTILYSVFPLISEVLPPITTVFIGIVFNRSLSCAFWNLLTIPLNGHHVTLAGKQAWGSFVQSLGVINSRSFRQENASLGQAHDCSRMRTLILASCVNKCFHF